jgi:hypothetical protein
MVVIVPKTTLHPIFLIRFSTSVNILPGGTYSKLCDLAEKQLRNNTDPKIVYFIAGIPDICTLTRDKKQKYEESYLNLEKDNFGRRSNIPRWQLPLCVYLNYRTKGLNIHLCHYI